MNAVTNVLDRIGGFLFRLWVKVLPVLKRLWKEEVTENQHGLKSIIRYVSYPVYATTEYIGPYLDRSGLLGKLALPFVFLWKLFWNTVKYLLGCGCFFVAACLILGGCLGAFWLFSEGSLFGQYFTLP